MTIYSDYLFYLPTYWRWFPKFFLEIFKWVFEQRMTKIMEEDNEWIYEQMTMAKPLTSTTCAPTVPERYDALDDLFKEDETFWMADARFEYYWTENFDGKGRLKRKS